MTTSRKTLVTTTLVAAMILGAVAPAFAWGWGYFFKKSPTIAEILEDDGRFETLLAAVDAAGLTDVFTGRKGYTLNAPTDAAFAKLPAGTVDALLEDIPTLTSILAYHVYEGRKSAKRLLWSRTTETLNGSAVFTYIEDGVAYHNRAKILETDKRARNGIVHVIDDVLLPPAETNKGRNLVEIMQLDGRFNTLLAAVEAAGLTETLSNTKRLVLNAPTDAAFAKLPEGTVDALLADIPTLTDILLYHVIQQRAGWSFWLVRKGEVETLLEDNFVEYEKDDGMVFVNDSKVIRADVRVRNGWLHTIDTVLLPPSDG
jgi:uncharacterized surface protein with fasciclin (FAS1) repeats